MAAHIDSVATSGIPQVNVAGLYFALRPGDLLFCWGSEYVSAGIEKFTGGPSHVLKAWLPWSTAPWLTLEAEFAKGVRVGKLEDYTRYAGDVVLCRRPLTIPQVEAELQLGFSLLDDGYDTIEFVSLVARRFVDRFPLLQPPDELYCSGLQQVIAQASVPFNVPTRPWATPEQLLTDPSVRTVCALLQGGS